MPTKTNTKSKISNWKEKAQANQRMLNLFSRHAPKKSISSVDGNLTELDPPVLNGVPYYATSTSYNTTIATIKSSSGNDDISSQYFGTLARDHAVEFTMRATVNNSTPDESPTESEFHSHAYKHVANGLHGEKERNLILEEQLQMLSQQAALALDRLSEVSKENEELKQENEKMKKAGRFSAVRRNVSVASSQSNDSVFSKEHMSMSQASSMTSIQSHLRQNSTYTEELSQSVEKELTSMKQQLTAVSEDLMQSKDQLSSTQEVLLRTKQSLDYTKQDFELSKDQLISTQNELISTKAELKRVNKEFAVLQEELENNQRTITLLKTKLEDVNMRLASSTSENTKLWKRFSTKSKQTEVENIHYKKQVAELVQQLMHRQQQDLKLRERLMGFDECKQTIQSVNSLLTKV